VTKKQLAEEARARRKEAKAREAEAREVEQRRLLALQAKLFEEATHQVARPLPSSVRSPSPLLHL